MASYIQSGTGATLTDAQIASGSFAANTFFIESGTGKQLSQSQIASAYTPPSTTQQTTQQPTAAPQPFGSNVPTTPGSPPNVGSTVPPPSNSGTPTLPQGTAGSTADLFHTSLASTLEAQQKQLQDALTAQTKNYQTKIDALNQQNADYQSSIDLGLTNERSTVEAEGKAKQAALDEEKARFDENYNARQKLTDQLKGLLETGQSVIEQMKATTGLTSIMSPRISKTMTDVQGQAGVITAALAAYDQQIGLAQSQLKSAVDAISSIYGDQVSYWKNVVDFYAGQKKDTTAQIVKLSSDQKDYIDAQIKTLQDNVANTQKTAQIIQQAMFDPKTALLYAKAGVSLTDTPAEINQKVALQVYAQEVSETSNKMAQDGYSSNPIAGVKPVQTVDSQGVVKNWYKITAPVQQTSGERDTAAVGQDLADARAFLAQHPDQKNAARATFLQHHPAAASQWDAYFQDTDGNTSYPTATTATTTKSGLFGLGFFGL